VVPSRLNTAVFCEIARICPAQKAQPRGAKFGAQPMIVARKASI